ncbi:hypothetical protein J7S33_04070, partial [Saccharothrix algeriensis]
MRPGRRGRSSGRRRRPGPAAGAEPPRAPSRPFGDQPRARPDPHIEQGDPQVHNTPGVVKAVTAQTFSEHVLQAERPVLIQFWATWCRPCLMVTP